MKLSGVTLRNIRSFEYLHIPLQHEDNREVLNQVLITGEASTGKSTLLESIAYSLKNLESQIKHEPGTWIRQGQTDGSIELTLQSPKAELVITSSFEINNGREQSHTTLSASSDNDLNQKLRIPVSWTSFLTPGSDLGRKRNEGYSNARKEPNESLWTTADMLIPGIGQRKGQNGFSSLSRSEWQLMGWLAALEDHEEKELISGEKQCILLIDDLGVGMHPRIQRTLLLGIRAWFPEAQIIASTVEPWIIQQVKGGETFSLKKSPLGAHQCTLYRMDPREKSIDQLMISSIYRMDSYESVALERLRNTLRPKSAQVDSDLKLADYQNQDLELTSEFKKRFQSLGNPVDEPSESFLTRAFKKLGKPKN